MRMVGLRDGNRELGAFRGVTRLAVDGNQGRGDVCRPLRYQVTMISAKAENNSK